MRRQRRYHEQPETASRAHAKPHPAPLLHALSEAGISAERTIYVGDDRRDIVAGRAAGMRTVVATYGYLGGFDDVTTWGGDASIDAPSGLLALLR